MTQPKLRNYIAISAWNRKGGSHGGSPKQKNRRDRKRAKRQLQTEKLDAPDNR